MLGYFRGMERELKDQRIAIMLSVSELRALDDWRRQQEDLPSRGEAVRRMLSQALAAETVQ
jgi:hypothetical protein